MPRPVTSILAKLMEFANKEMVVACPECHEKIRIVRNGRYWRYAYHLKKAIGIQRHLCRNHQCKRRSFSILPFPLLPYLRVTATFMVVLVLIHTEESARNISRQMDLVRSSVRRWRKKGRTAGEMADRQGGVV